MFALPAGGFVANDDGTLGFAMPALSGDVIEFDPTKDADTVPEETIPEGPPGSVLEVRYLHEIHDSFKNQWTIRPAPPPTEEDKAAKQDGAKYSVFAFTVIRRFNYSQDGKANTFNVTTSLQINSPELVDVGKEVLRHVQGISWTAKPLRVRCVASGRERLKLNLSNRLIRTHSCPGSQSCKRT